MFTSLFADLNTSVHVSL